MADEPNQTAPTESQDRGLFDLPDFGALARGFLQWCRANPVGCVLLLLTLGFLGYYYFGIKAFLSLSQTPAQWMASTWNSANDQEHCVAIIPLAIFLLLSRWRDLAAAPKVPSNTGIVWIAAGVFAMVAAIRCVEGRYSIIALPMLCYGSAMFLFGKQVARIALFPSAFLLFMVPIGGLVQGTAQLQGLTATFAAGLSSLIGIPTHTQGAMLISSNGKFEPMEVAGGCSGIRSLMAMMMLSALYAYYVMRTPFRGFLLFGCSLFFALIGNLVRVFSVVLVARFMGNQTANSYHDWSGFVFFPVAVLAMVGVGNLLNRDWKILAPPEREPAPSPAASESPTPTSSAETAPHQPPKPQATYDY